MSVFYLCERAVGIKIKFMQLRDLDNILVDYPKFRRKQVRYAIYDELISGWQEATALPLELREELKEKFPIEIPAEVLISEDGTVKALIVLGDGAHVEAVLMRHNDGRNTVCVSSQVGCPLNCAFCATGKMGFVRDLTDWEMVLQVLFFARWLKQREESRVSNVVFMGMGEPFLNYDNTIGAVRVLNAEDGMDLGARNISISTVGIPRGIYKLSEEGLQINLAISLHAPNNELRSRLMPINNKYSMEEVFEAVDAYIDKTNRKVMFEYLLIKGVNDSEEQARELAELMNNYLYVVNLITYNPTGEFEASDGKQVKKFKRVLEENNVNVTQRFSFGRDIKGACGQLANN